MSVTRRGFLGIGAAVIGGALLPGPDPTSSCSGALDSCSGESAEYDALLTKLEAEGMRHGPPQFEELGKVIADEIQATMQRPSFADRIFEPHYAPIEKEELLRSGKVGVLHDFHITGVSAVEGTEFGYVIEDA